LSPSDRNGVYILRLTVAAGEQNGLAAAASHTALVSHAPAVADADPEEEARAALERPHGIHCSLPLAEY
jgi:hypothetical protein